ncbi:MAG TPA: acyl-phosphate glycerol 3-phosphate acyltransferase [Betaproteobacteria bacterium]|jgi:acyl phosphate:glycerol-3-phosphate acyltransferase|nr:acyl-phosphate glycerol 3-phosphate acyltransferase [Betaproteobacteria bacterium]
MSHVSGLRICTNNTIREVKTLIFDVPVIGLIAVSYLVGSVSFAVIVSRVMSLPSPYSYGSENPGATNVLRTGNKLAALLTLLGDGAKGFFAVRCLPGWILPEAFWSGYEWAVGLALIGVLLGHVFPVFHAFKGGKGVATAAGGLLALDFHVGFSVLLIWLIVSVVSRYSSLAALCATLMAPFIVFWHLDNLELAALTVVVSVILTLRHKKNIVNLLNGVESKIGKKDKSSR